MHNQASPSPKTSDNSALSNWLHHHGLLLCGFAWQDLPQSIASAVLNACPSATDDITKSPEHTTLWLMANAGPTFWRRLQASPLHAQPDPVDSYSVALAETIQSRFLNSKANRQLYPASAGQGHIPLMRLGAMANWSVSSPLGLSLHPTYGPWFAYRCAWLSESRAVPHSFIVSATYTEADITRLALNASLCSGCAAPCVKECPAQAVSKASGAQFNSTRCHDYRTPKDSSCHADCHARRACPIGREHQYDDAQLTYHMGMRWKI